MTNAPSGRVFHCGVRCGTVPALLRCAFARATWAGWSGMVDPEFRRWLTHRSWGLMVRYCKAVGWLLPIAALAKDAPLWLSEVPAQHAKLAGLLAWQAAIGAAVYGVLLADRLLPRLRGQEFALYAFCGLFMAIITWAGVTGVRTQGTGLAIYAACSTFMAAVIATPLPVRGPLYVAGLAALAWAKWGSVHSLEALVGFMVNPFCVAMLCLWLERFTYSRDLALFRETRRAEAERARADEVLSNTMPRAVADELKRNGRVPARKVPNMGVLFADLVGFTRYASQLPPDAVVLMLDGVFSAFDALVERHGVEKIKTIGDAYMVVAEDDTAALCALALAMREAVDAYNQANGTRLAMRIGVHAGPAVAGVVGTRRLLYDVWGDTVNVASRVESAGRAGSILVTEAVARQAAHHYAFATRGPVDLQGRGRVATAWLVGPRMDRGGDDLPLPAGARLARVA
ncbi:MAG: adenylate/guanylate cyclase domain-containing protein [Comamonadaceae bacterium]|nr:MAG: adenylate/guanylate cyclase domain-containing protein [Comamonadaceae bacterium]